MYHIDYSKIEINIPKVTMNFMLSVYFYMLQYLVYLSFFHKYSFLFLLAIIGSTFIVVRYVYNVCIHTNMAPLFIFISLVLSVYFTRNNTILMCNIAFLLYALLTLKLLYSYGLKQTNFINKYKNMINFNKFISVFSVVFALFLAYFLLLAFLSSSFIASHEFIYYIIPADNVFFNAIKYFGDTFKEHMFIVVYIIFPLIILSSVISMYTNFLLKCQYVFTVCPLSEYGQIPLSSITYKFKNTNVRKEYMQKWFDENIGMYIKNIHLDAENKMIVFGDSDTSVNYKENISQISYAETADYEYIKYSLDESLKKLDTLMNGLVYKGTNLTGVLYNMKSYLEKINILHKDKHRYNKYIYRINNRYIPYVEYLVETYIKNIDLKDESINNIQGKIELSLNNILEVFKSMYKSNVENMKFNIENEIDAMELLIRQKGLVKNEIK